MTGQQAYRRTDARESLSMGLAGVFPASWRPAEENAAVEVWLSIEERTAVCGLRLSDRTMRHRTWKTEHRPASLRPTIAAAMVRLAGAGPGHVVLDPMCGTGTIPGEMIELSRQRKAGHVIIRAGDIEMDALRAARTNLGRLGPVELARWDARRLPLETASIDRIVTNPPFGRQLSTPEEIEPLYNALLREWDRVLRPGGRAVMLVAETKSLRDAAKNVGWDPLRQLRVEVLGQPASISIWTKPE